MLIIFIECEYLMHMSDVGIGMQCRKASSNGHLESRVCTTHDGPGMMNSILYHTIKPKQVMNKTF